VNPGGRVPRLDWERDGRDWPNRDASRFVDAAGLRWHVQRSGPGRPNAPALLLLHGTGAATHSWRDLLPRLARRFEVIAPDLPGHGFTAMPPPERLSLPGMAASLAGLLRTLGCAPAMLIGHSAGAAVAARIALDGGCTPAGVVGLNGAWLPPGGSAGRWFSPAARLLATGGAVLPAHLFARAAARGPLLERLLAATGSSLDSAGRSAYATLVSNPGHVAGTISMMAHWDVAGLADALPALRARLLLVVGERDRTVPPIQSAALAARVAGSRLVRLRGLGHLAHEEAPEAVIAELEGFAAELGIGARHPDQIV
jgi:magnesium chelatase accessory protein